MIDIPIAAGAALALSLSPILALLAGACVTAGPTPSQAQPTPEVVRGDPVVFSRLGGEVLAVDVAGCVAFSGEGDSLVIVDVADPTEPSEVGRLALGATVGAVNVEEGRAYVAAGWSRLYIVDVRDPIRPVRLSKIPIRRAHGVDVSPDDTLYVAGDLGIVGLVDVTDPRSPFPLGRCGVAIDITDVRFDLASGSVFALGYGGLYSIDVSDRANPLLTGVVPPGRIRHRTGPYKL